MIMNGLPVLQQHVEEVNANQHCRCNVTVCTARNGGRGLQHLPALDLCLRDYLTASTGKTQLCYNVPAVPATEADRNWQATLT